MFRVVAAACIVSASGSASIGTATFMHLPVVSWGAVGQDQAADRAPNRAAAADRGAGRDRGVVRVAAQVVVAGRGVEAGREVVRLTHACRTRSRAIATNAITVFRATAPSERPTHSRSPAAAFLI